MTGKSLRPTLQATTRVTTARIILTAQTLSVAASVLGLIGLAIAYKSLVRDFRGAVPVPQQPPTIH